MTASRTAEVGSETAMHGREAFLDAIEDVLFGSIAGAVGKVIEYPFDTVKVRLQSQPDHLPLRYTGPLDCFKQSLHSDGFLGLYRGLSAPLVGAAIETSSLFFWERVARESFFKAGLYDRDRSLPLSALFLTGAMSGAFTSLLLTPIELVKCKIQAPATSSREGAIRVHTPLRVMRDVFQHQGLRGFWHGQLGTLIRETGGSAAWFGTKETVTLVFRKLNTRSSLYPNSSIGPLATSKPVASGNALTPLPLWQQAVAGASAGMSYNFLFFPADTIKSRMQTTSVHSSAPKTRFWAEGMSIYRQYGFKGLYRGCGITVARSAPSSAFIFIIFDSLKEKFSFR